MNRLVRALLGVVVAKAAVASAWYLYQKSTEQENDWKTEGKEPVKVDNKDKIEPVSMSPQTEISKEKQPVVESEVVKPKRISKPVDGEMVKPKRIRKPATKKGESTATKEETQKPKKVRKSVAKKERQTPTVETK